MQAALNFSPGVSVFILDPVSFNVSFGVFGFILKREADGGRGKIRKQIHVRSKFPVQYFQY